MIYLRFLTVVIQICFLGYVLGAEQVFKFYLCPHSSCPNHCSSSAKVGSPKRKSHSTNKHQSNCFAKYFTKNDSESLKFHDNLFPTPITLNVLNIKKMHITSDKLDENENMNTTIVCKNESQSESVGSVKRENHVNSNRVIDDIEENLEDYPEESRRGSLGQTHRERPEECKRDSKRESRKECQKKCQKKCQSECLIECQNKCKNQCLTNCMSECLSGCQLDYHRACHKKCLKECHKKCYKEDTKKEKKENKKDSPKKSKKDSKPVCPHHCRNPEDYCFVCHDHNNCHETNSYVY